MPRNNPYPTETRSIYRDGRYIGNIIIEKRISPSFTEEEYDDLIYQTFPELKQKKNEPRLLNMR